MPNIKSAEKRVKVINKKTKINRSVRSQVNNAIKKFRTAVMSANAAEAEKLLPEVYSVIDSAVAKGVLHKNNAANKKSGLAKLLFKLKSGQIKIEVDLKTKIAEKRAREKAEREAARAQKEEKEEAKKPAKKSKAKAEKAAE